MTPLALASLVTAVCFFVSMLVAILAGIRLAERLETMEWRYGRLLARYTRIRAEQEESGEIVVPGWVNGAAASLRRRRREAAMDELRKAHEKATKGEDER